jgi:eukaryotic-like serine/threonine-protein kinase
VKSADGYVYALNATTGEKLWNVLVGGDGYRDLVPIVSNGVVYIEGSPGTVDAFDTVTHEKLWEFSIRPFGWVGASIISGVAYLWGGDNRIYALDAATGEKLWESTSDMLPTNPAVIGGVAYFWSPDGNVYAIDPETGRELGNYTYSYSGEGIYYSPTTVANGVVYAGMTKNDGIWELDAIVVSCISSMKSGK